MSVPTWKRSMSKSQFLYELYQLNITVGEIMDNQSKKHKDNYSNHVIKTALYALQMAQTANEIYFNAQTANLQDYQIRHDCLVKALGAVDNVSTVAEIFLEMVRKSGTVEEEKVYRQEQRIGQACLNCHNLLKGVIKSDKEIAKKSIKQAKA